MKFGENLKSLRKKQKISQEDLADKVGVSRQSVSKWETGDAYPEMNNILQLCKIFHCHINDLVHASMSDINSLDEEIKMKVVKFQKEKQKKMKGISKAIYVISGIGKRIMLVVSILVALLMLVGPVVVPDVEIVGNDIVYKNNKIGFVEDEVTINKAIDVLETHSNMELIIYSEIILLCLVLTCVLLFLVLKYLEKLFVNIHSGETPFILENVSYIKNIAKLLIVSILFPSLMGLIMQAVMQVDLDINVGIIDLIFVLIIYSVAYIFEYGYELQKDSKGVMYDEEK